MLLLKDVPADRLANFSATFIDLCGKPIVRDRRFDLQATFPQLHEDTTLLFYFDYDGLNQANGSLSVNSSLVVLYSENIIRKPLEGGKARLYTLFYLFEYAPFSGALEKQKVFIFSSHSGDLKVHEMWNSSSTYWRNDSPDAFEIWETVGYLDPFEIEVGSNENDSKIVMGFGEKQRGVLKGLEQGATYVQLIWGDLKGVSNCCSNKKEKTFTLLFLPLLFRTSNSQSY